MSDKINVGIVGATGYTGVELLRLLTTHPNTKVTTVTSRSENGKIVSDHFPSLRGIYTLTFQSPEDAKLEECDVVFFATPNGVAMKEVPDLLAKGVRIIDLSADFRIHDITIWEKWYGMTHACPHLVSQAVYGLCEMDKQDIAKAHLIANPGCYPTCVSLPLLPLLKQSCLKEDMPLIADCKSGVSGAGRKQASVHYCVKQETILKLTISQVIDIYLKSSKLSINYKKYCRKFCICAAFDSNDSRNAGNNLSAFKRRNTS